MPTFFRPAYPDLRLSFLLISVSVSRISSLRSDILCASVSYPNIKQTGDARLFLFYMPGRRKQAFRPGI